MEKSDIVEKLEKILKNLNNPNIEVRAYAITALGNIGIKHPQLIEDTIPRLVELLIDEDPDVCEVAYNALQDLIEKQQKTIEKIIPKLKEVMLRVVAETDMFKEYHLEDLTRFLKETIMERHPEVFEDTIPKLIEKLDNPSEEVRKRSIWIPGGNRRERTRNS